MAQGLFVLKCIDESYNIIPNMLLNDKNTAYICLMQGNANFIYTFCESFIEYIVLSYSLEPR